MGLLGDFKRFAFRGNVVDLAVGVIIGGAFGRIVSALVEDVLMPLINLSLPGGAWREAAWVLRAGHGETSPILLHWGHFVGAVLDLGVVSLALFLLVSRVLGRSMAPPPPPASRTCPACLESVPAAARRCRACTSDL